MRTLKVKVFKGGDTYFVDSRATIHPLEEVVEEYDLKDLVKEDIDKLRLNPKNKTLLRKGKKIK